MAELEADWPEGERLNMRAFMKGYDATISELTDATLGVPMWDIREISGGGEACG